MRCRTARVGEPPMDEAGRPLADLADRERSYEWDAEGRLVHVSQTGKPTASYRYDHRGLRVSKQRGAMCRKPVCRASS